MAKGGKIKKRKVAESDTFCKELAKQSGVSYDTAKKENAIMASENQDIINDVVNGKLSVNKAHNLVKKLKKEVEEPKTNDTDTLPVEESVEVEIETVEVNDDIYTITITDNYDNVELDNELSNTIKQQAKMYGRPSLLLIEDSLKQYFK